MATRYLTVANLKLWMRSEIPTADDTFLDQAIQAAETTLDNACQRRFALYAGGGATARTFNVRGCSPVLNIHDCTTITSVVESGTTLVAGVDYQAEPLNNLSDTGETWPYYRLVKAWGEWYSTSTKLATVTVTATWGWPAIPPQILEACKIIAKDEFNQRSDFGGGGVSFGLVGITEAGGVGTRENAIVRAAVSNYAHPNALGIA